MMSRPVDTKRAICFYSLPDDLNKTAFRFELENFGEVKDLEFPVKDNNWDNTCYVSFLYDSDLERLITQVPKIKFCGYQLKAKWSYIPVHQ